MQLKSKVIREIRNGIRPRLELTDLSEKLTSVLWNMIIKKMVVTSDFVLMSGR